MLRRRAKRWADAKAYAVEPLVKALTNVDQRVALS